MAPDDPNFWTGSVNEITKITEQQIGSVRETLESKHEYLLETIERYAQREQHDDSSVKELIKAETDQTDAKVKQLTNSVDNFEAMLD